MVGHAGSPTRIVYVDVTLTWSNVKVMVTSLTFWSSDNLRTGRGYNLVIMTAGRLQQAVHAGGDDHQPPCGAADFLKTDR